MVDLLHISGGYPLYGECRIQGSKNAVLPIMAAAVLVDGIVVLDNCPEIADVFCMQKLLQSIGCRICFSAGRMVIDSREITGSEMPKEYVVRMRSSVILMGALLGRMGCVKICYPGGCVIGERPIDMHLDAFSKMGVMLQEEGDCLTAVTEHLQGSIIYLPFPSVGATENTILAAALAHKETVIHGCAMEPEIDALCDFLLCAGAHIEKRENGSIRIEGKEKLCSCHFKIPPDRIVTGTYLLSGMAAGGCIRLMGTDERQLAAVLTVIREMGGDCCVDEDCICLKAPKNPRPIPYLKTEVYPGFPTDLQSPLLAVLALAEGESRIEETIFENRFKVVPELIKMGADIHVDGRCARIKGVKELHGAKVCAEELRGGAALCVAALAAKGNTEIANRHFIDRGYENLERDFRSLGGRI